MWVIVIDFIVFMQEFQLRVIPLQDKDFALDLYQCAYKKAGEKNGQQLNVLDGLRDIL
jgi:hypothetical protein